MLTTMTYNSDSTSFLDERFHPQDTQCFDYGSYLVDVSCMMLSNLCLNVKKDLIRGLFKQSRVSYSILLVSLIYLLRYIQLKQINQQFSSLKSNGHDSGLRLMTTCLVLACKFVQDRNASNEAWASLAHCSVDDLNDEERLVLNGLQYRLWVTEKVFSKWTQYLFKRDNLTNYLLDKPNRFYSPPPSPYNITNSLMRTNKKYYCGDVMKNGCSASVKRRRPHCTKLHEEGTEGL